MLYRKPQFSAAALARSVTHRIAAAVGSFHRSGTDAAYLDSLRTEQLHDLGIRRIETRDFRFYR